MNDLSSDPDRVARALWISVRNLTTNSEELDALWGEIIETLTEEPISGLNFEDDQDTHEECTDWVVASFSETLTVRRVVKGKKGRPKKIGDVTVVMRLYDSREEQGSGWPGACTPKLILAFSPNGAWAVDDLRLAGDGRSDVAVPGSARRWYWAENGGHEAASWFFCVPLADLSADALRPQVIDPLVKLINGASDEEAFPQSALAFPTTTASA